MGRGKIIRSESTFPHSFLLLVSLAIKYVTVYAVKRRLWCLAVCTESLEDLYFRHKNHLLSMATESTKAKNDFGTDHRTPLVSASCFTAQLTSMAQRVVVAMNHCFSATAPNAQGLCHSLSQTSRLFNSSTAMARKQRHGPSAVHDKIIHLTDGPEIGTRLWT